jgi:Ca2+-binding EF-hand superfamily protein
MVRDYNLALNLLRAIMSLVSLQGSGFNYHPGENMNKIILQLIATGCLASFALASSACEPAGPMADRHFDEVDTNHDGAISKAEANAYLNKRFKEIDANHDGKITREEIEAHDMNMHDKVSAKMQDRFNQRFDEADANHDGVLTKSEAEKMPMILEHFDEFDANHDGKVSKEEIKAMMQEHHHGGYGDGHPAGQMMQEHQHGGYDDGHPVDQPEPMKPMKE